MSMLEDQGGRGVDEAHFVNPNPPWSTLDETTHKAQQKGTRDDSPRKPQGTQGYKERPNDDDNEAQTTKP